MNMDKTDDDTLPTESDYRLQLAQKIFLLRLPKHDVCFHGAASVGVDLPALQKELLDRGMTKTYKTLCEDFELMADAETLENAENVNSAKEKDLEEKIKDAEENLGEVEVRDAMHTKAVFLRNIGDDKRAEEAFTLTEAKTAGVGQKLDMLFMLWRSSMANGDWVAVKKLLHRAKQLFEEGGDWERKNRMKVYEGIYALATREFKRAAELFLESVTTFTSNELFDYTTLVFYAVITAIISLDRVNLKKKVVDCPEIRSVIGKVPHLEELIHSYYECRYDCYLKAMFGLSTAIYQDMFLNAHFRYTIREMRVVGYSQFLESYKSVTVSSMASSFGISEDFLDKEISSFICKGRLNCKIDRVAEIIETIRPDSKNALYQSVIKNGDFLLNRVQKLSKVIEL